MALCCGKICRFTFQGFLLSGGPSDFSKLSCLLVSRASLNTNGTVKQDDEDVSSKQREEKRNVSRLSSVLRNRMKHVLTPEEPVPHFEYHQTVTYKRKMYAKYGKASGINPGVMWPTKEELTKIIEDENEWEPTLHEMWAKIKEDEESEFRDRREKEELVEKQMARMPEYIKQFKARLHKQDEDLRRQEAKKKELLEEARDFYGYNIDPRDPRFKQMQEIKAEEEKKQKKLRKKQQKEARHLAFMERALGSPPSVSSSSSPQSGSKSESS